MAEAAIEHTGNYYPVSHPRIYDFVGWKTARDYKKRDGYHYYGAGNVTTVAGSRLLLARHIGKDDPQAIAFGLHSYDGTEVHQIAKKELMPHLVEALEVERNAILYASLARFGSLGLRQAEALSLRFAPKEDTDEEYKKAGIKQYILGKLFMKMCGTIGIDRRLPLHSQSPEVQADINSVVNGGGVLISYFEATRTPEVDRELSPDNPVGIKQGMMKWAIADALSRRVGSAGAVGMDGGMNGSIYPVDTPLITIYSKMTTLPQIEDVEEKFKDSRERKRVVMPVARELADELEKQLTGVQLEARSRVEELRQSV